MGHTMEAESLSLSCDDAYIFLMLNEDDDDADQAMISDDIISDNKYAHHLHLQEAIMASLSHPHQPMEKQEEEKKEEEEVAESSQTLCEICTERKDRLEMFKVPNCTHQFCTECISKHVSISISIKNPLSEKAPFLACPGLDCKGVLYIDACREIVSRDVAVAWDEALCKAMIAPSERFYCPYKNCSALLVKDEEEMREAECPVCRRLMCVRCNVPWHCGVDCDEFSRLGKNERGREDLMVHELARKNKWKRCPSCKFFVERKEGCLHMTCRCGFQFCYECGTAWRDRGRGGGCVHG